MSGVDDPNTAGYVILGGMALMGLLMGGIWYSLDEDMAASRQAHRREVRLKKQKDRRARVLLNRLKRAEIAYHLGPKNEERLTQYGNVYEMINRAAGKCFEGNPIDVRTRHVIALEKELNSVYQGFQRPTLEANAA
jgi:hypothetical protein